MHGLRFNYGSQLSLREAASDTRYHRYFQELDQDRYSKVIEKALLESLVLFLDDKGVDTSELVARQTTILNQGVYITGGASVSAQNIAAGAKAQARSGVSAVTDSVTRTTGVGRRS
jgi:hypothetical protein